MKRPLLWAPWRMQYVKADKDDRCVFCHALGEDRDRENLIVSRGDAVCVVLNRYPYTAGHLMVIPIRHVASVEDLGEEDVMEFWSTLVRAKKALTEAIGPDGFNVGMNLGPAAGAGIDSHLHLHVVPRWAGDTNFLPVLDGPRVVSQGLLEMYDSLHPYFG